MRDIDELYNYAKRNPASLKFRDLIWLVEALGYRFSRQRGSHVLYDRPGLLRPLNFQPIGDMAKPAQVRELIRAHEEWLRGNASVPDKKEP